MKQFIVLFAVLPLMIGLILQIGLAQSNFISVLRAESIVRDCSGAAANEGGFTSGIRSEMASRLAAVCGSSSGNLHISVDKEPGEKGSLHYRVEIPIEKLVAAPGLFGVKEAGNSTVYVIEGTVYSRKVEEKPEKPASEPDDKKDDAGDGTDAEKLGGAEDGENTEESADRENGSGKSTV